MVKRNLTFGIKEKKKKQHLIISNFFPFDFHLDEKYAYSLRAKYRIMLINFHTKKQQHPTTKCFIFVFRCTFVFSINHVWYMQFLFMVIKQFESLPQLLDLLHFGVPNMKLNNKEQKKARAYIQTTPIKCIQVNLKFNSIC